MNCFDIIGPVMIGPSSSHTAGACRIGKVAYSLLDSKAIKTEIVFHGSFAKTYRGHGTDKAIVAGILGMDTDDVRIRDSFEHAKNAGVAIDIKTGYFEDAHPNTARVTLTGASGQQVEVMGASVGGGEILIERINGMEVSISGQYATLIVLHKDMPGTIAAVTTYVSERDINICNFRLARESKGGTAVMTIELEGEIKPDLAKGLVQIKHVRHAILLKPLAKPIV